MDALPSWAFQKDIEHIIRDGRLPWSRLQGASLLITGATGLIGSVLLRVLRAASDRYGLHLYIAGMGRNKEMIPRLTEEYGADCVIHTDIREPFPSEALPECVDFIFHCAAITKSSDMVANPVGVITTAILGTQNILELARRKKCRGFVYLSSMEVYGQTELLEVRETDLGYLDLTNPRSSYPQSKRLCESLCAAYAAQYGVPAKIARLALTFGAGTPNREDNQRVAMQFARKAMANEDIVLHTPGNSLANCCYTTDAVSGLLYILLKGNSAEAYNVANPKASMTVREMAETVVNEVCGGKNNVVVDVPEDIAKRGYAPDRGHRLNADKLMALGWQPRYGIKEMYERMVADWKVGK